MLQTDPLEHTEAAADHGAAASAAAPPVPGTPNATAVSRELLFQRCRWCATPAFRRSFCRTCGSTAFDRQRSQGSGVVVRRNGYAPHNTWFVAMDEGFNLLCQVTGTAPVAVAVGARVSVVRSSALLGEGLPVVELTRPPAPLGRWW
ncbi:Zn-ribbon domain-containing OB-fold protein [Streptomyces turgidiscabies]|uniref:ChsH2 rubredoxin-like zinc ribbon domain-containing protein n=1 Tax=Streptomyces turgidiscabies (strain Car8) TaxID=698760 RepID=L7FCN7_STRT8|nr:MULTISPECIES: zinc ribbon domain-containing protein [Streptomyces]ELP69323.1 hypothetical protein STRTUCAR8_08687 [Streptomyces turgidiscabies Car8]MDX3494929.1 zinc ribbon domain-containing protein [Streptomyces turgidiscabies]GAQ70802.1 hypothetical protein T45_02543 [Streptomyces turgidiscabies]